MRKRVLSIIAEHGMLGPGMGVVVGLSGGADSVALAHFLSNLREYDPPLSIICVHVHHGLRGREADEDAEFCAEYCARLGVELVTFRRNAAEEAARLGASVEEAGRVLRYACFNEVMRKRGYSKIAVAHTANDVAESVLMQIARGSGGIRGIAAARGAVIRPFIDIDRHGVLDYCARHNLAYRVDSTNSSNVHSRNWVRNVLLPQFAQNLNPDVAAALCRLARISADDDAYLGKIAKDAYEKCVKSREIDIGFLNSFDRAIQRRVVRIVLAEALGGAKDVSLVHVESVLALAQSGKRVSLPRGLVAEREYSTICIRKPARGDVFSVNLPKNGRIFVPQIGAWVSLGHEIIQENAFTKALDCGKITDVQVRTRRAGDRIFFAEVGTKKIKDFLIDKKIPRAAREGFVFIACGQDIIVMGDARSKGEAPIKWLESDKFSPSGEAVPIYLQITTKHGG